MSNHMTGDRVDNQPASVDFEVHDHLGNIRVKTTQNPNTNGIATGLSYYNYYAFGSLEPFRYYEPGAASSFGFNGQERKDDYEGIGGHNHALYWEYNTMAGRRWDMDPVVSYSQSPYVVFGDGPTFNIDPNGDLFFGLFGSTSEQRQAAKAYQAKHGGSTERVLHKDIHNHQEGYEKENDDGSSGVTYVRPKDNYFTPGGISSGSTFDPDAQEFTDYVWNNWAYEHQRQIDGPIHAISDPFTSLGPGLIKAGLQYGAEQLIISQSEKQVEKQAMTTVGRWMSQEEYTIMSKTNRMVEGGGGQTFVATGGPTSFPSAPNGSVYAEFDVPNNSLLQGGKENWFKTLGPNASKSQQLLLQKQGGSTLPAIQNLTPILQTK